MELKSGQILDKLMEYDSIISDIYGVIHDGVNLFTGSKRMFNALIKANKKVILLSNAPRRSVHAEIKLQQMGFFDDFTCDVITSGEVFYQNALSGQLKESGFFGKYYFLGSPEDSGILNDIDGFQNTENIKECDFVITSGTGRNNGIIDAYELDKVLNSNKKIVCLNPDVVVFSSGRKVLCGGSVGNLLKMSGCDVSFYGKPYNEVYDYIFNKYNFNRNSSIAIGDSFLTDITGANNQKISSLLTKCGVHFDELKKLSVEEVGNKFGIMPTFWCDELL